MPASVYRLTSPSGKVYIGVSTNVKARWASHVRRARDLKKRHPLYDAIRSYGAELFTVEVLCTVPDIETARFLEVMEIILHRATDRARGYNISPGGEYDCLVGPEKFWREIRLDPIAYAAYRANLSAAQQKRSAAGLIDAKGLVAFNKALSPRERWRRAYRALRFARRNPAKGIRNFKPKGHGEAVRAAWKNMPPSVKKRHSIRSRKSATQQWVNRTDEQIVDVSKKISDSVRALHDDPAYRERNLAGLLKGRQNMDRRVQGAAASKGIKQFWIDLKADPVRYASYIDARKVTLKKTLLGKGYKCK